LASWRSGKPPGPLTAFSIAIVALVLVLDQVSKLIAEAKLPLGEAIEIPPILTLYRVNNTGIAFSFLAGAGPAVLIGVMIAVMAVVIVLWLRSHDGGRLAAAGYALILGGALGNLIDRLRFGHVIDFLLLHIGDRTLFVFNLADAALTLGPVLLIAIYLLPAGGEKP
jgi:signal peptidase II